VRALTIRDGALVVTERPAPEPGPGDVVVRVVAAGINAADLLQRDGFYPAPAGFPPDIPGMELAGVVTRVGRDVDDALLGTRVCALVGGGAQAAECVVAAEHLLAVPDAASWKEAGGFAETFSTAYDALVTQAHLESGERVLISGAAGGVGVAAVQIAHALGATVVAVTRNAEPHEQLKSLGADETVTLDDLSDLERVDVILELLGAAHLNVAQRRLRPFGRVVVIGVGAGRVVELDLLSLMATRAQFTGSTLRSRTREEKASVAAAVRENLLPLWAKGDIQVPLAAVYELADATAAYEFFATPGKFGKVVLRIES